MNKAHFIFILASVKNEPFIVTFLNFNQLIYVFDLIL